MYEAFLWLVQVSSRWNTTHFHRSLLLCLIFSTVTNIFIALNMLSWIWHECANYKNGLPTNDINSFPQFYLIIFWCICVMHDYLYYNTPYTAVLYQVIGYDNISDNVVLFSFGVVVNMEVSYKYMQKKKKKKKKREISKILKIKS